MRKPEGFSSSGNCSLSSEGGKNPSDSAIGNEAYLKKIPTDHVGIK
jgi:hypothetical protein